MTTWAGPHSLEGMGDVAICGCLGGVVRRTHVGCACAIRAGAGLQQTGGDTYQITTRKRIDWVMFSALLNAGREAY